MALTHNSFQVKIMVVFLAIMLLMFSAAAALPIPLLTSVVGSFFNIIAFSTHILVQVEREATHAVSEMLQL
ncbi:hypothetical protein ERO13_A05G322601v2 [Gossypium hirsutum]|uniref:Uncharacterized protein n=3 Tax=Gossypium TaxID=3633 RepID=A0A2P5XJ80_GOSBA|nr:hypothetical protein [Gossypium barbadense]KAG4202096.1 hypothetical protein ERO13_A05G322601v2 [Gossypium hirsutum]PPS03408.1 hypothetical protein GOBAR_AA17254 [Gossypium barbadense]TYH19420.1 hypothetical protein ES288_A05G350400v1 [Gossypium darwinii]TYI30006.1 hypothetical protein ES332_A05G354600v1 [Gossypium tomentosum]